MGLRGNGTDCTNGSMPVRLNLMVDDALIDELDEWRRGEKNPPSRGRAAKRAMKIGLEVMKRRASGESPPPPLHEPDPEADDDGGDEDEADKAAPAPNAAKLPAGATPKPAPGGKPKTGG